MKYCEYCNETYNDNLWKCPKCGQFLSKKTPNKSGRSGSIFAVILVIIMLFVLPKACSSSKSQYDKDLHSGLDKMRNGNGSSMTESEKQAANDFFEWQSKQ